MKVALITIGNELLSGFTVDTNAAWIGQELLKVGAQVAVHHTIGDDKSQIIAMLDATYRNVDAVIVTGGLGPTHDDVTPSAFYSYFQSKPVFDSEYWEQLRNRFSKANYNIPEINRNQAFRPHNGEVIPNPVGSARGLHYRKEHCHLFALPGVPKEMKSMMTETVLPWFESRMTTTFRVRTIRTTGIPESALAEKVRPVLSRETVCRIAFLPQLTGVDIRLFCDEEEALARQEKAIVSGIKKYIYGYDKQTIEETVGRLITDKGYTIATAESCTGGLLGHRITNVPGSSKYFRGGVVAYSNVVKEKLLGVKPGTLNRHGAVSEETALEMARGVQSLLAADIGVSITGIAGPAGGTPEKPVGLAYVGVAVREETIVKKFRFTRDREGNKLLSSQAALNMIRKALQDE